MSYRNWARYTAIDADGTKTQFSHEPEPHDSSQRWVIYARMGHTDVISKGEPCKNWKDTLVKIPGGPEYHYS